MDVLEDTDTFSPQMRELVSALAEDDWLGFDYPAQAITAAMSKNIDNFDVSPRLKKAVDSGSMYEVEIDASPDEFLDWDTPLSDQTGSLREKLSAIYSDQKWGSFEPENVESLMANLEKSRVGNPGYKRKPADLLSKQGIPGVRYKDANSRGKEGGTSNYVVFDENLISIARKYGIAIPAAAAMLARQTGQNPEDMYEEDEA